MYLNNAATTVVKPDGVKNAEPKTEQETREKLARLFAMKKPENIILTNGGTEALRIAIKGLVKKGDHVITTVTECGPVYDLLSEAGCELSYVGINVPYGTLNYDEIEPMIKENTRWFVMNFGSNITGNIPDMERISTIARRHHIRIIADGAQSVGASDICFENTGIDVLCFAAHKKLMGPFGTGAILTKENIRIPQEVVDEIPHVDPEKLGGLCAALDFIHDKGIYGISVLPHRLEKRFFESVNAMKGVTVYGDFGTGTRIPTLSIKVDGFTSEEIKEHMHKHHITIQAGSHNCPMIHRYLGTADTGLARFSFGYFNTRRDVNDAIWAMMDLLGLDDLYYLA